MHKVEIDRTRKKNVKFTHRDFDTCLTVTDRSCRQPIKSVRMWDVCIPQLDVMSM